MGKLAKHSQWKDWSDPLHIGTAVKSALGLKEQDVPPPVPLPDEKTLESVRKRRLAGIMQRGGRSSTILSDATLGG